MKDSSSLGAVLEEETNTGSQANPVITMYDLLHVRSSSI